MFVSSGADSMQNCLNALVAGSADRRANQHAYALYIEDLQKIRGQVLGMILNIVRNIFWKS
jgi:hypothetical protein